MELYPVYHHEIPKFLLDLARTGIMRRLTDVGMNCGCEYTSFPIFQTCRPSSRYEHSLGVGLIVWHFTGDMAQAVAGLLHDIATPVFAHVVDFLNGDHMKQESTESQTEKMIAADGELQAALRKYGLTTEQVADYHRYPVADNDSPRLSADRLEYTLNNLAAFGLCTLEEIQGFYGDLTLDGDELSFRTPQIAAEFTRAALRTSRIYICEEDRYSMEYLAGVLRMATDSKVLSADDLYTTESQVIVRLKVAEETAPQWQHFCSFSKISRSKKAKDGFLAVAAKKRYIDPLIVGKARVSEVFPAIGGEIRGFLDTHFDYWLSAE